MHSIMSNQPLDCCRMAAHDVMSFKENYPASIEA
uniref:Uncharacterized protein n=1 Tax=Rhizophora mucronata TaxID=61149 RepID=A0A2P2K7N1_RHIMU